MDICMHDAYSSRFTPMTKVYQKRVQQNRSQSKSHVMNTHPSLWKDLTLPHLNQKTNLWDNRSSNPEAETGIKRHVSHKAEYHKYNKIIIT